MKPYDQGNKVFLLLFFFFFNTTVQKFGVCQIFFSYTHEGIYLIKNIVNYYYNLK